MSDLNVGDLVTIKGGLRGEDTYLDQDTYEQLVGITFEIKHIHPKYVAPITNSGELRPAYVSNILCVEPDGTVTTTIDNRGIWFTREFLELVFTT